MSTVLSYVLCLSKYSYVFSLDKRVGVLDLFPNMEIRTASMRCPKEFRQKFLHLIPAIVLQRSGRENLYLIRLKLPYVISKEFAKIVS